MIATLFFMAVSVSYAQTIPSPHWPLDSVVNGAVKSFTVQGDQNYDEPSTFTWTVYGGRLFFDEELTQPAGDGSTVTLLGDSVSNTTQIWVIWDVFTVPVDYGYIYLSEVSADSCQKDVLDQTKYQGLNIKVKAPPNVRFLSPETLTCSNEEGVIVEIEIDGFAPFELKYSYDGTVIDWHVEPGEMIDSDFDGKENNLILVVDDYTGTTVDKVYQFELLEASSEGVFGEIQTYPTHTVYAFVQPDAPVITELWTEVTQGTSKLMTLDDPGVDVDTWFWEFYSADNSLYWEFSSSSQSFANINFNFPPGDYYLISYFQSQNGCFSLTDTLDMVVYPEPYISFADSSDHAMGCSSVSIDPDDSFEFVVDYQGALSYDFSYAVYDYNNTLLGEFDVDFVTVRNPIITIPNDFFNEELPQINRTWKVVITSARNGEGVDVEILDGTLPGGRDQRNIVIHPKPIIIDDIDFEN